VTAAVVWNEDCVPGMAARLEEGSVDLTVTSIPFADLFTYSHKTEDLGNCGAAGVDFVGSQFGLHLRFFCEQLLRVTRPGTNACVHVQQLVATKVEHGFIGRRNFRDDVIHLFEASGFEWKGEFAIAKNPQAIAQRQKLHSLLFVTGARDARQLAPAVNDYVLIFQRPGEAPPVRALRHDSNPDGWVSTEEWIRDAHGVWTDIRETDVLDGWQGGREEGDEKHVCPLQLEVIRRCVRLYSNPSELVLDPFAGIGSTGHVALEQGRRFVGFELKESYHRLAERNLAKALHGETAAGQLALATEAA
jgi:DNA modification methylase